MKKEGWIGPIGLIDGVDKAKRLEREKEAKLDSEVLKMVQLYRPQLRTIRTLQKQARRLWKYLTYPKCLGRKVAVEIITVADSLRF